MSNYPQKSFSDRIDDHLNNGVAVYFWLLTAIAFTTFANAELGRIISRLEWAGEFGKFLHGLTFAILIDIGVFILAATGERKAATFVMYYSILAHILYFHPWDDFIELYFGGYYENGILIKYTSNNLLFYKKLAIAILKTIASIAASIALPKLVFFFSEKIAERRLFQKLKEIIKGLYEEISELKRKKSELERLTSEVERKVSEIEQEGERKLSALNKEISRLEKIVSSNKEEISEQESIVTELKTQQTKIRNSIAGLSKGKAFQELNGKESIETSNH